jgi:quercetin dioxygenase-like cupin family protein
MARPHIEYIQSQAVPWQPSPTRPGAWAKTLSDDMDTGAATRLMRYPPDWHIHQPHYLESDEEFFVFDGALWVGSMEYKKGDYAYLPAGMPRAGMHSDTGAVVLTFHEGRHHSIDDENPGPMYDAARLIAKLETATMPWTDPSDPIVAATANDAGRKLLRDDPVTGERTWMLRFGADDPKKMTHGRVESHPVVEEMFLIDGEVSMPYGTLQPGAYFWRPAHIPHGPVGTLKGLHGFFRCKGGPLTTQWSKEELPIAWNAPHKPMVPPAYAAFATTNYDASLPY